MTERPGSVEPEDFIPKRDVDPADVLSVEQIKDLREWLAGQLSGRTPEILAKSDQFSAELKEGFGLLEVDIEDPKTYYIGFVMLGMIVSYLDHAKKTGQSHEEIMRAVAFGFANLAPEALKQGPDTREE